jgi:hypothetical protein
MGELVGRGSGGDGNSNGVTSNVLPPYGTAPYGVADCAVLFGGNS